MAKTFLWNAMAKRYAKTSIADQASYEKKLEITRRYLTPEDEVLEIGCGTGATALLHAPYVKHIEATDFAKNMIAIAKQRLNGSDIDNIDFVVESVEDLANKNQQYDVILALNILHILEDKRSAINNLYRLLKPGGYLISSTACIDLKSVPLWIKLLIKPFSLLGLGPTLMELSKSDLLSMMEDAGFALSEQWKPEGTDAVIFLVNQKSL